jgi:hypothetical protein
LRQNNILSLRFRGSAVVNQITLLLLCPDLVCLYCLPIKTRSAISMTLAGILPVGLRELNNTTSVQHRFVKNCLHFAADGGNAARTK